jgi:hypothetical protein
VGILKNRCNLLGSSIVNVVEGKDTKFLSEDLRDSIGRLVVYVSFLEYSLTFKYLKSGYRGIQDTLEAANKAKATGFWAYALAEDDIDVLNNANKSLDKLLQCFSVCFPVPVVSDLLN